MLRIRVSAFVGIFLSLLLLTGGASAQSFQVTETSIADIHQALHDGTITCHELADQYLKRIAAYDQARPKINAMLYVNPRALQQADAMDQEIKRTGKMKPLECIPIV